MLLAELASLHVAAREEGGRSSAELEALHGLIAGLVGDNGVALSPAVEDEPTVEDALLDAGLAGVIPRG